MDKVDKNRLEVLQESIYKTRNLNPNVPSKYLLTAYDYIKNIYNNLNKDEYNSILFDLYSCESNMPELYICDCNTNFVLPNLLPNLNGLEKGEYLKQLSTVNRICAMKAYYFYKNKKCSYNNLDATNLCDDTTFFFKQYRDENNIKCERIKIEPGFDKKANLYDGRGFHYFNIITTINGKNIYDVTYKQFFKMKYNFLQRLGIVDFPLVNPGIYMMINDRRRKTAEELLKKGFIKYNEENLKNYLDGFALSYRNGLYYEQIGNTNYETNYTFNDYERFLFTDDSQVKHESLEVLGRQKTGLKNPNFDFSYHKSL